MFSSDLNALLDQQALQGQDPECRYITDRVNWEQYQALLEMAILRHIELPI